MAAKDPRSPGGPADPPGWRRGGQPQTGPARPGPPRAAGWAKKKDRGYERAARWHRLRIGIWILLLAGLIGGFVVWLIWTPMRTPFLVAVVTDYPAPIPPNGFAQEDRERLRELDAEEILKYLPVDWQSKESGLRNLRRELDAATPGGPGKDLVIVYLSMHGAVDSSGEPCLLSPGASPLQSGQWLRLRDLLDYLFPKDGSGKRSGEVKKLLILDCGRMDARWRLGLLYNGFADRLPAVVEEAQVPGLAVLNSAGPGQVGWASPQLGNSVFAFFLRQGLNGAADAEQTGDADGVVTLGELHAYLKAHVAQWVTENRADRQQPMLLPADADFPLVYAQSSQQTRIPEGRQGDGAGWDAVASLWEIHAKLSREDPYRLDPLRWEEFQHKLLRLEQLLQAGKAYADEWRDVRSELDALAGRLAAARTDQGLAAYSLPLARRLGTWPSDQELKQAAAGLVTALEGTQANDGPGPPADAPKAGGETGPPAAPTAAPGPSQPGNDSEETGQPDAPPPAEKAAAEAEPSAGAAAAKPYEYLAASAAAWGHVRQAVSKEQMPAVLQFIDHAAGAPRADVVEVHLLRMLDAHLDPQVWETGLPQVARALAAHHLGEQAAAPQDPRACYWIRPTVDQADGQRRLAEDQLFVGGREALAEADRRWREVVGKEGQGGAYGAAIARADEVAEAFRVRDQAWAELPYLAQWLLARLHESDDSQLDVLDEAIQSTHRLAADLEESLRRGEWTPQLAVQAAELRQKLDRLRGPFDRECSRLRTAGQDQQTLRAIHTAMAVPLLTGQQRNRLRSDYLALARKLHAASSGRRAAVAERASRKPPAAEAAADAIGDLRRLTRGKEHPAVAILSRQGPAAGQATRDPRQPPGAREPPPEEGQLLRETAVKRLAAEGEEVRRRLASVAEEANRRADQSRRVLAEPDPQPPAATRSGYSAADRLVRAAAGLSSQRVIAPLSADPVHLLRELDVHYLMLWQAERTLDDFWGPAPGGRESFFEIAAADYVDSAQRLCKQDPALQRLSGLLQRRKAAARQAVRPEKPKDLFVDENDPAIQHRFDVAVAEHLPSGVAGLYLEDPAGEPLAVGKAAASSTPVRRMGLEVQEAGRRSSPDYWIPNRQRLQNTSTLQATALYRGHLRQSAFYVQPATGFDLVCQRPDYPPPTITVYGKARKSSSVVFVFDCSGSMGNRLELNGVPTTRLNVARDTLLGILQKLSDPKSPYRVGLRIYGHRVGRNPQNPRELVIRDPKNPRRFIPRPPELAHVHPSNDVQPILNPGEFTTEDLRDVSRQLNSLWHLGETPLYLAIIQAMDDLRSETEVDQKRVIAITDGFNKQSGSGRHIKYLEDLRAELRQHRDVCLDLVGFHLVAENAEEQRTLKALERLAEGTGGGFHSAREPDSLLRALEKSLGLEQYVVETIPGGRSVTQTALDLNTTCTEIPRPANRPVPYLVRITNPERPVTAEVEVRGGEALELWLLEDPRRLAHRRYDKALRDSCDRVPAPLDERGRSFFGGAHLPDWEGSAVRFFFSLQNSQAEQFSPRPEEVWVQVRPLLPEGHPEAARLYSFFEVRFEPDCPVPVFSCLAPGWPPEAKRAQMRICCKLKKTPPDEVLTVAEFREQPPQIGRPGEISFAIETARGQSAREPYRVTITERHPDGQDLYRVKIEMSPAAEQIKRRYNAKTGTVRHTFFYDDSAATEIATYRILLTTRQRLVEGAIILPRPLEVSLTRD